MMKNEIYYLTAMPSPFGEITLTSDGSNLTGLWLPKQKYFSDDSRFIDEQMTVELIKINDLEIFQKTQVWLERYFAGEAPDPQALELKPEGSAFRQAVWKLLCEIPYGQTVTYGSIADKIAAQRRVDRMSAQAVGGAVGHNPISIIIPCHRVVGANGSLTGYGGGIDMKIRLLMHEQVDMSRFFVPKHGTAL